MAEYTLIDVLGPGRYKENLEESMGAIAYGIPLRSMSREDLLVLLRTLEGIHANTHAELQGRVNFLLDGRRE